MIRSYLVKVEYFRGGKRPFPGGSLIRDRYEKSDFSAHVISILTQIKGSKQRHPLVTMSPDTEKTFVLILACVAIAIDKRHAKFENSHQS